MPAERIAPELVERIPLDQLNFLRGNPRRGDHAVIREILTSLGQMEPIVVNRGTHTAVANEIVGGNNRVRVMRDLGWSEVAVSWVDVPDETTLRKLAIALNRAGEKATWDDRLLAELLAGIAGEGDLLGTGFDDAAYDELMRTTDLLGDQAAGFLGSLTDDGVSDSDLGATPPAPERPAPPVSPPQSPATPPPAPPTPERDEAALAAAAAQAAEPTRPGPPPASRKLGEGYVAMSWMVLPEDRDLVFRAIGEAKRRWDLEQSPDALVAICGDFLKPR